MLRKTLDQLEVEKEARRIVKKWRDEDEVAGIVPDDDQDDASTLTSGATKKDDPLISSLISVYDDDVRAEDDDDDDDNFAERDRLEQLAPGNWKMSSAEVRGPYRKPRASPHTALNHMYHPGIIPLNQI